MTNITLLNKSIKSQRKLNVAKFIAIIIAIGIFFRFYNLEQKTYWYDETMTSVRISGYVAPELTNEVYHGEVISVGNFLQTYQYPNDTKNFNDTIKALAKNPEHSPLYYLMARFWLQATGNSIFNIRFLSALISLLAFPAIYWLCLELFNSKLVSWVSVCLIAISPFHVLYAQEAREYSLWIVSIFVSCAALLWAIRKKTILPWIIYGTTVSFGLYTHPFSAFVFVGHGIYVLVSESFRLSKALKNYIFASFLGILLFVPWLLVVIANFSYLLGNTDHVNRIAKGLLPILWGLNLSRIFIDVNQGISLFNPLTYLSLFFAVYALYFVCKTAPKAGLFIITLIGVLGIALIAPDIIISGRRSTFARYATPCLLGIQVAVSYLLATKLREKYNQKKGFKKWRNIVIVLIVGGILSSTISSQVSMWWNKGPFKTRHTTEVVNMINQSENPLVISDIPPNELLGLTHVLQENVHLQLISSAKIPQIPASFEEIFIYRSSDELLAKYQTEYEIKEIEPFLWKMKQR
ncbi:MAG: glycosyltransferase family 39 protein [Rivularia sp. (in: cyanobacteria)]